MTARARIAIIGAGPTGLGAAWRLEELGFHDWLLVDAADHAGGLASSVVDERGFTWDLGGHVLFSHYEYFDRLMDTLLGDAWLDRVRESWVWMRDRFIPYPLQNNIWRLPPEDLIRCLDGLLSIRGRNHDGMMPANFREWILRQFGTGLADVFMLPYNFKVWAYDPEKLGVGWMGERVATVDLQRILHNLVLQKDDLGWGPNARFRYPLRGGTGAIWRALHERLPADRVQLGRRVARVDTAARMLRFEDGGTLRYETLISTMALDDLLRVLGDRPDLTRRASEFRYSSGHIVGVGLEGSVPKVLRTKCWMYFPEPDVPFYRVTVFSNYSPHNVPDASRHWSLLCEVSESPDKAVDHERIGQQVVAGLHRVGFVSADATPVSLWRRRLEHAYPTPFVGRDELLDAIDPALRELGIWTRGRFGAWKYEVSNQDHSLMQGVEAIEHLLAGGEEITYRKPGVVNSGKQVRAAAAST